LCCFRPGRGKPVIDPREIVGERVLSGKCVLMVFHPTLLRIARSLLQGARPVNLSGMVFRSVEGAYRGAELVAVLPYPGAPFAVAALEILAAMGAQLFIVVGRVGAIHPQLDVGDVLVPTWGIREEGTSYHYVPDPSYVPRPDEGLAKALHDHVRALVGRRRVRVVMGGVWTTDAVFRETLDKVIEYSAKGVYGVDMESTALMTVAECLGVRLAIVASVSDKLSHDGAWMRGFHTRRLRETEKLVVRAALDVVAEVGAVRG